MNPAEVIGEFVLGHLLALLLRLPDAHLMQFGCDGRWWALVCVACLLVREKGICVCARAHARRCVGACVRS